MLGFLIEAGGRASAADIRNALDIGHRQLLASHANLLARADLVHVKQARHGNAYTTILMITDLGREQAGLGDLNALAPTPPP